MVQLSRSRARDDNSCSSNLLRKGSQEKPLKMLSGTGQTRVRNSEKSMDLDHVPASASSFRASLDYTMSHCLYLLETREVIDIS